VVQVTDYHGFTLARDRQPLADPIPDDLVPAAREAMADAVLAGKSRHPNRPGVARAAARIAEYWRRSGGSVPGAHPHTVRDRLLDQLRDVRSWGAFIETPLRLDPQDFVRAEDRERLDALPGSASVLGDRLPIEYRVEGGRGVAWLKLREKQAYRLRTEDLPALPMPLRFSVMRGRREVARAASLAELETVLARLETRRRHVQEHPRRGRRRR
jgi:hypothetical protein